MTIMDVGRGLASFESETAVATSEEKGNESATPAQGEFKYAPLSVDEVYRSAVKFYKEKENNASAHVSYEDRVKLAAFSKQAIHGKYVNGKTDAGFFDWFGNDRLAAWEALGDVTKEEAMSGFVDLLDNVCPPFRSYMETQKKMAIDTRHVEEEKRKQDSEAAVEVSANGPDSKQPLIQRFPSEQDKQRFEAQRHQIEEALNQQTYHQFRAYADQQYPGDPEKQAALIKQLQDQHYQQYMAQVYAQQAAMQPNGPNGTAQQSAEGLDALEAGVAGTHISQKREGEMERGSGSDADSEQSDADENEEGPSNPNIAPASMWTRKDIKEFKEAIKKEGSEGIIKVGHGETVTVRVPTHEEGTCLFWEFSTDSYDIGFGVYFEWTIADSNVVSVHISESSDEELEDEGTPEGEKGADLESAGNDRDKAADKPQIDEIIPVYRRDCHEEVYAGSHVYPERGVYLLKFDNSYSLWRSKTLYYRVYYSK